MVRCPPSNTFSLFFLKKKYVSVSCHFKEKYILKNKKRRHKPRGIAGAEAKKGGYPSKNLIKISKIVWNVTKIGFNDSFSEQDWNFFDKKNSCTMKFSTYFKPKNDLFGEISGVLYFWDVESKSMYPPA